jgi:hypothetical protein
MNKEMEKRLDICTKTLLVSSVANRSFDATKAKANNRNAAKKNSGGNPKEAEPARDKKEAKEEGPLPSRHRSVSLLMIDSPILCMQ